jgi:hypothetical protein
VGGRAKRVYPSTPVLQKYVRAHGRTNVSKVELGLWAYRLAAEEGLVTLLYPEAEALPPKTPASVERVWRGFLLLCACRWACVYGAPVVFGRKFAAAWCSVTEDQAREAITTLSQDGLGFMLDVGRKGHLREWLPRGVRTV